MHLVFTEIHSHMKNISRKVLHDLRALLHTRLCYKEVAEDLRGLYEKLKRYEGQANIM